VLAEENFMDASHAWGTDMENNNDQIALGKAVETVADTLLITPSTK